MLSKVLWLLLIAPALGTNNTSSSDSPTSSADVVGTNGNSSTTGDSPTSSADDVGTNGNSSTTGDVDGASSTSTAGGNGGADASSTSTAGGTGGAGDSSTSTAGGNGGAGESPTSTAEVAGNAGGSSTSTAGAEQVKDASPTSTAEETSTTAVAAATIKSELTATFDGLSTNVTSKCPESCTAMNLNLAGNSAGACDALKLQWSVDECRQCAAGGAVPENVDFCQSRDVPVSTGFHASVSYDSSLGHYDCTQCGTRRLDRVESRRLAAGNPTLKDTLVIEVKANPTAAGISVAALQSPAFQSSMQTKVNAVQLAIKEAVTTGNGLAAILAKIPKTPSGNSATPAVFTGDVADSNPDNINVVATALQESIGTEIAAVTVSTVAAEPTAVTTSEDSSTSSAAAALLSTAAILGAAVMW